MVLPWIHFYDSSLTTPSTVPTLVRTASNADPVSPINASNEPKSVRLSQIQCRNPHKDKMRPKVKYKFSDRLKFYFTAPVTKFQYSMVGT